MERDDDLRAACFLALDALRAQFGDDLPYRGVLDRGFVFENTRVSFLTRMRGIYRARLQRGPAALSVNTSFNSPYNDEVTPDGFLYAYQAGAIDNADNVWLRKAHQLQVPIVYFWGGTRPGWYRPIVCFVKEDYPLERSVLLAPTPGEGLSVEPADTVIEQRYAVRETRLRMHQGRFRGAVLLAYDDQCTICRLKEIVLLDAAHITADSAPDGKPLISNGLSMCSIHHRAYDQNLVGVSPDFEVRVSQRLLEEEDGPMLELLKGFDRAKIRLPVRRKNHPDRERLAARFELFSSG